MRACYARMLCMHAYYACIFCMHIIHACTICMHIMHAYYACTHTMHEHYACIAVANFCPTSVARRLAARRRAALSLRALSPPRGVGARLGARASISRSAAPRSESQEESPRVVSEVQTWDKSSQLLTIDFSASRNKQINIMHASRHVVHAYYAYHACMHACRHACILCMHIMHA